MSELRVKVVIDTEQLRWWMAKHRALGNNSVAAVLSVAADHYENTLTVDDVEPPAPPYPAGLNGAELQRWATWHIDRGPVGVAHTLWAATEQQHRAPDTR